MSMQLVSKISNLCDPDPPTSQTDGQRDGQHAISIPRYALVHRVVKKSTSVLRRNMNDGHEVAKFVLCLANVEMCSNRTSNMRTLISNNGMHCAILKTDELFLKPRANTGFNGILFFSRLILFLHKKMYIPWLLQS